MAQDRLVKGLRVAGANTLEAANRYLAEEFLPWWNQHLTVIPANATDAHRPLAAEHNLAAALSHVETRQVDNNYTLALDGKRYQIERADIRPGLRGGTVRVEARLDGSIAVRFQEQYLAVKLCPPQSKRAAAAAPAVVRRSRPARPTEASRAAIGRLLRGKSLPTWMAGQIDRTRTRDTLEE